MDTDIRNFELIREIGSDAEGRIFLARNKSTHQFVAVKKLHPVYESSSVLRDGFRKEAARLSALDHANIVRFINYVENDAGVYLITEYIDGVSLDEFVFNRNGLIVEERALPMMAAILDAFIYAHANGVVHGNVDLRNVILTRDGNIKIRNFGTSELFRAALAETDMAPSAVFRPTAFMSPEMVDRAGKPDVASDIYALGIMFHSMLTARAPFSLEDGKGLVEAIKSSQLVKMKTIYPYVSDRMQKIVDKATQKAPESRYSSVMEMKLDLPSVRKKSEKKDNSGQADGGGVKVPGKNGSGSLRIILICIAAALVLVLAGWGGYMYYQRNSAREFYYYSEYNGLPTGIMPARKEGPRYVFSYSGGQLKRLELVGADGHPHVEIDSVLAVYRPVNVVYDYDANGRLTGKSVSDPEGRHLYDVEYHEDYTHATIEWGSHYDGPEHVKLIYDVPRRQLIKVEFEDDSGNPEVASDGVAGQRYAYDSAGRLTRVSNIDSNGATVNDGKGVGSIVFDYAPEGHKVTTTLFDASGKML